MSKKHKKVCWVLNYIDHSLIAISTITGCVFISDFASFVGTCIRSTSSANGLKICVLTAGFKMYKAMVKKKKKKQDKVVLLAKSKLNSIVSLNDSNISLDEFVLINNVLKEFYNMKEEIKF